MDRIKWPIFSRIVAIPGIVWNEIPVLTNLYHAVAREGPVSADRVDRRSPELEPFEGDAGVLKVDSLGKMFPGHER
jgi:hypothetical protein